MELQPGALLVMDIKVGSFGGGFLYTVDGRDNTHSMDFFSITCKSGLGESNHYRSMICGNLRSVVICT